MKMKNFLKNIRKLNLNKKFNYILIKKCFFNKFHTSKIK